MRIFKETGMLYFLLLTKSNFLNADNSWNINKMLSNVAYSYFDKTHRIYLGAS